ncbi:MAG: hypothetical protein WCH99_07425 [Verrucomicrobiota bacterium]
MHLNCKNVANPGDQNLPPGTSSAPASRPPAAKPASRRFAIASAIVGGVGALGYLVLVVLALKAIAYVNESTRGSSNPLMVMGDGFALGYWFGFILLFALLFFCGNCLGLILSGVALCRSNGRELGLFGLLLNILPVAIFFWFLATRLPSP